MARPGETIGSPYSRQGEVHVVEDRRIPSYRVGDMMEAEIRFEYEPGLQEIVAFFIHLERVMNSGENRIEMRIPRSAWFPRDLRFPHS
jgi:hypothetical protein